MGPASGVKGSENGAGEPFWLQSATIGVVFGVADGGNAPRDGFISTILRWARVRQSPPGLSNRPKIFNLATRTQQSPNSPRSDRRRSRTSNSIADRRRPANPLVQSGGWALSSGIVKYNWLESLERPSQTVVYFEASKGFAMILARMSLEYCRPACSSALISKPSDP